MNYRREIDGLRAVAVLPVILFHAGFKLFCGGFVGVDVFFVISGYLITSVILSETQAGTFTLVGFYERRARRILPALFFVMLACLPFAWLWMLPDDFENFGQSLVATTYFGNNILLWLTSGYFTLANEFKPLVHTWSLGVEEQYYILYPLFFLLFWRSGRRCLISLLVVMTIISLTLAKWGSANDPVATFYILPTRGWELLIGALTSFFLFSNNKPTATLVGRRIALDVPTDQPVTCHRASRTNEINDKKGKTNQSFRQGASFTGLLLISYAVFAFDKSTPFLGASLIPSLGAAFIIMFATEQTWVARLLSSKWFVAIGLISYSAYLWHQPLFAFARLRSLDEPGSLVFLALALLACLLAYPTWLYIERPLRNRNIFKRKTIFLSAIVMSLIISSIGFVINFTSGFEYLWPDLSADMKSAGRKLNLLYNEKPYQFKNALFHDPNKIHVLILGYSYTRDFINSGLENNYFSKSEISYIDSALTCLKDKEEVGMHLSRLIAKSDYLIFGSPIISLDCWKTDFAIFKEIGAKKIVVIGDKNFGWNMNAMMRLDPNERYNYRAKVLDTDWRENEKIAQALPNEYFVNLLSIIADAEGRVPVFTEDHNIISQDTGHLTKHGAKFIGKRIFEHPLLVQLR